ncbi:MAG: hypothetical protein JWO32_769 [Bacteroidetes bacterium]|nr:hypothetical protein [Bacteroidota bacterium]
MRVWTHTIPNKLAIYEPAIFNLAGLPKFYFPLIIFQVDPYRS